MSLEPPSEPTPDASVPARFRFGDVEVDVGAMRVVRGGVPLELEPKVFDLLVFLACNPGRVVGKEEILERVWDGAFVTDNALARAVAQLRRALGDDAAHARYIETVRTRGYRFVADVEPRDQSPVQPASQPALGATLSAVVPAAPPTDPSDGESSVLASRVVAVVLAAVVLITVALASRQLLRAARVGVERRAAVTGEPRQLTVSPGYDGGPTFSPDGRYLAFSSERRSGNGEASAEESGDSRPPAAPANESTVAELAPEIVVRRLQDGEELQLTRDGTGNVYPAWSPDDRWIAYHSMARGGLWLVSPLGGAPRRLTEFGSQPEWSPDGKSVVFCSQAATALAPWSWAASRDALLWVVDVETGALRQLTQPGQPPGGHGEPAWSPDGRNVVFSAGDELGRSSLWWVESAGGQPMQVEATSSPGEEKEKLDWRSPVFVTADTLLAVRSMRGYSVWRVPLWGAGAAVEVLPVAPEGIGNLSLAPAGDFLAFAAHAASSRIVSVTLGPDGRPLDSRAVATASRRLSNPGFSPDGRKLYYLRARGGAPPDIVVHELESGAEQVLEGLDGYPLWSSASSLVTWGVGGATSIDLRTGQRRKLELPGPWLAGSAYRATFRNPTPDLERVVFGSRLQESPFALELFVWGARDAEPRQLTELGGFAEFPSWSRDARRLAFQVSRPGRPEQDELWVVDVDGGGPPHRVLRLPGRSWGPRFDAAAERVVYAAQRGGRWDLAIAGTAPSSGDDESERRLGVNSGYMAYVRWPDWSPSEDRIVFEQTQMTADVWLLPLRPARPPTGDS